jgi:hypothetical protein
MNCVMQVGLASPYPTPRLRYYQRGRRRGTFGRDFRLFVGFCKGGIA